MNVAIAMTIAVSNLGGKPGSIKEPERGGSGLFLHRILDEKEATEDSQKLKGQLRSEHLLGSTAEFGKRALCYLNN
jgi:hypothetical protein